MKGRLIISLDQGTTSSRAVVFDRESGSIRAIRSRELRQIYPRPGWVEQDPEDIWTSQLQAVRDVIADIETELADVACIGITNQRETVMVWDKKTGVPIHNAIVWQCRRTADICNHLKFDGYDEIIRKKTGLVIDAYFSGTKIKWLLDNVEGARERAEAGGLLAGTVDSWLVWKLTGGRLHVTDYSNASRTMLFNIHTLEWDGDLLERLGIPRCMLSKVVPSSGYIGETTGEIFGSPIPIGGIAGDQQAALFGQTCFEAGSVKNTYGTGCFILMNTGSLPVSSKKRLLTTIAWNIDGRTEYALEGSVFNAGSAIQWLRDELRLIDNAAQSGELAAGFPDTGGVYVVPAFTGLGAPYWDMYARGAILGITRGTKSGHIVRAVLESIAYQSRDVFEAMKADSGVDLKELKVDGGASASDFLMQFQADIMNMEVKRPRITETTALGAAYLAGLGIGMWGGKEEIAREWVLDRVFTPSMGEETIKKKYADWKRAVERSMKWDD